MGYFSCFRTTPLCISAINPFKAPRHLVVHDNLQTVTKYIERSVQNLWGLHQLSVLCTLGQSTNRSIEDQRL